MLRNVELCPVVSSGKWSVLLGAGVRCDASCCDIESPGGGSNGIGDEGAKALASAFAGCRSLRSLRIKGNNISSEGRGRLFAGANNAKGERVEIHLEDP